MQRAGGWTAPVKRIKKLRLGLHMPEVVNTERGKFDRKFRSCEDQTPFSIEFSAAFERERSAECGKDEDAEGVGLREAPAQEDAKLCH